MTRFAFLMLLLAAGCNAAARVTDSPEITAALAVDGARAIVRARKVHAPPPVVPAGVCPRCCGKGYVGDESSIRIKCDACKGTGKVPQ